MLLTTYNDLSSMPLFSPEPFGKLFLPSFSLVLLVPLVGPLVVPFDGVGTAVDCPVIFAVVLLVLLAGDDVL